MTEDVNALIKPDSAATFIFAKRADMEAVGAYALTVGVACGDTTTSASVAFNHKDVLEQLPLSDDFASGMGDNWHGHNEGSWEYEWMGSRIATSLTGLDNALFSPCMRLDGPVRMKIAYSGGRFYSTGAMKVVLGPSGSDPSTWRTVYSDMETPSDGRQTEFAIDSIEPGLYTMAVVNASEETDVTLAVYSITVSGIFDNDLRAIEAQTALAAQTPAEQYNAEGDYSLLVENRGTAAINGITTSMSVGDAKCFESVANISILPGDTALVTARGTMPKGNVGDVVKGARLNAAIDGEKYAADNGIGFGDVLLTDYVFATESMTKIESGIGLSWQTAKFGNVYTLNTADTLTSVTIGLAADEWYTEHNIGVNVYSLKTDGRTIDRKLWGTTTERGAAGGLRTFSFPARLLPAGRYFVEVDQITPNNVGVGNDANDLDAVFYQSDGDSLYTITGAGSILVRANFGHDGKVYKRNVALEEFTSPVKTKGLLGTADSVGVSMTNLGTDAIADMRVVCTVDGKATGEQVVSLLPYETRTVMFHNVNLAAEGDHQISVSAELDGDECPTDNTLQLTVTSVAEADPYKLDFESCDDFDHGRQFNPRWWTVDRVGALTNAWAFYDYPYKEEPVGFMVWNLDAMSADFSIDGFYAHGGKRFGMAFSTDTQMDLVQSDVWLVSPKLALGSGSSLNMFVKFPPLGYGDEVNTYRVLVSTTDDNFDNFTAIGGDRTWSGTEWTEVSVDLSAYDNKPVYVALQYVSLSGQSVGMMVDDIEVKTNLASISSLAADGSGIGISVRDGAVVVTAAQPMQSVELYSVSGAKLYGAEAYGKRSMAIDARGLAQGLYVAKVKTANGEKTVKLRL